MLIVVINAGGAPQPFGTAFNYNSQLGGSNGRVNGKFNLRSSLYRDDQGANLAQGPTELTHVLGQIGVLTAEPGCRTNVSNGAAAGDPAAAQAGRRTPTAAAPSSGFDSIFPRNTRSDARRVSAFRAGSRAWRAQHNKHKQPTNERL